MNAFLNFCGTAWKICIKHFLSARKQVVYVKEKRLCRELRVNPLLFPWGTIFT